MSAFSDFRPIDGFLSLASHNTKVTQQKCPKLFDKLEAIHSTYHKLIDALNSPKHFLSRYFVLRTHSSFLAGANLSCCTQLADSYAVTRVMLENALYGFFLSRHPELADTWINRQDSRASRARTRSSFKIGPMMKELDSVDAKTGDRFRRLYEDVFDYGAHPNVASILTNTETTETENGIEISHAYFNAAEPNLQLALKTLARAAVLTFDIFELIWPSDPAFTKLRNTIDLLKVGL